MTYKRPWKPLVHREHPLREKDLKGLPEIKTMNSPRRHIPPMPQLPPRSEQTPIARPKAPPKPRRVRPTLPPSVTNPSPKIRQILADDIGAFTFAELMERHDVSKSYLRRVLNEANERGVINTMPKLTRAAARPKSWYLEVAEAAEYLRPKEVMEKFGIQQINRYYDAVWRGRKFMKEIDDGQT